MTTIEQIADRYLERIVIHSTNWKDARIELLVALHEAYALERVAPPTADTEADQLIKTQRAELRAQRTELRAQRTELRAQDAQIQNLQMELDPSNRIVASQSEKLALPPNNADPYICDTAARLASQCWMSDPKWCVDTAIALSDELKKRGLR